MTPVGFAKLGLRTLAAYLLYLGLNLVSMTIQLGLQEASAISNSSFTETTIYLLSELAAMLMLSWLFWFRAESLAWRLAPAGAMRDIGPHYDKWQALMSMFAGWLLLLQGLAFFVRAIVAPFNTQWAQIVIELFAALCLIIGIADVVAILRKVLSLMRSFSPAKL